MRVYTEGQGPEGFEARRTQGEREYCIYWADGWLLAEDEPVGVAAKLAEADTLEEAALKRHQWAVGPAADRHGSGVVVVLDAWGRRVGPPFRAYLPGDEH